jgi:uncharacterized protein YcaQ
MPAPTLDDLRRYAVARSLFAPTTLIRAIRKLGFVQADPIRAPARAQDLILRHRVKEYRAGDLERRYPRLEVEEDFFINYGFLPREHWVRMHPRRARHAWSATNKKRAAALLGFIRERGVVHPRELAAHFAHGTVTNYWGGSSNATTHLLDGMHYRSLLRVVRRDGGMRLYAAHDHPPAASDSGAIAAQLDALVDLVVHTYAPLPAASLGPLISRLRYATPQWGPQLTAALTRAKQRLAQARIAATDWYWPANERPMAARHAVAEQVRLLAPFDPVVWDRRRFQLFWDWAYRFEAYTPAPKRKLGYYALPILWRDRAVGWANLQWKDARLTCQLGFVAGRPDGAFDRALEEELARMQRFLGD